ncbi:hypothetical protein, partial [Alistipes communis]|uniref:hypothetical protein n=1 Tax=Alistipes communis TaxID=2585118 RepID=UPI00307ADD3A
RFIGGAFGVRVRPVATQTGRRRIPPSGRSGRPDRNLLPAKIGFIEWIYKLPNAFSRFFRPETKKIRE